MKIVTTARLNRALASVIRDFEHFGIWNGRLYGVDVFLVPVGFAYGWKRNGAGGHIHIPAVSISRLSWKLFRMGEHWGLRDVLRHEYAHAVADLYPRLSRSRDFLSAFSGSYDRGRPVEEYHPGTHVTAYASTQPSEDFAEVFMYFIKQRGRMPRAFDTPGIRRKWRFVAGMVRCIGAAVCLQNGHRKATKPQEVAR
jgi:hypothetical protein